MRHANILNRRWHLKDYYSRSANSFRSDSLLTTVDTHAGRDALLVPRFSGWVDWNITHCFLTVSESTINYLASQRIASSNISRSSWLASRQQLSDSLTSKTVRADGLNNALVGAQRTFYCCCWRRRNKVKPTHTVHVNSRSFDGHWSDRPQRFVVSVRCSVMDHGWLYTYSSTDRVLHVL